MKLTILLSFVAAVSLPLFAANAPDDGKSLTGVWKPADATLGGQVLPAAALKVITLKIDGEKYDVTIEGAGSDKGTCKLDTEVSPKRMAIKSTEGANAGKTFPAIYEIKDTNTLQICYDLSGAQYPAEFKSTAGTKLYLVTYKREKK